MASNRTHNLKKRYKLLSALSLILQFAPICAFVIPAFIQAHTEQKLVLGLTAILAIVVVLINCLNKVAPRSVVWILLLGIVVAMDNIAPLIITMGICTIIDEIIVTPILLDVKNKFKINKEIDLRE